MTTSTTRRARALPHGFSRTSRRERDAFVERFGHDVRSLRAQERHARARRRGAPTS